eukprot:3332956-Prymnesium_polylepis.1
MCVLTGYEDAAHEHGKRARRANDASGVPRRGVCSRATGTTHANMAHTCEDARTTRAGSHAQQ